MHMRSTSATLPNESERLVKHSTSRAEPNKYSGASSGNRIMTRDVLLRTLEIMFNYISLNLRFGCSVICNALTVITQRDFWNNEQQR